MQLHYNDLDSASVLFSAKRVCLDIETDNSPPDGKTYTFPYGLSYLADVRFVALYGDSALDDVFVFQLPRVHGSLKGAEADFDHPTVAFLRQLLTQPNTMYIGHNVVFDLRSLCGHFDAPLHATSRVWDTLVIAARLMFGVASDSNANGLSLYDQVKRFGWQPVFAPNDFEFYQHMKKTYRDNYDLLVDDVTKTPALFSDYQLPDVPFADAVFAHYVAMDVVQTYRLYLRQSEFVLQVKDRDTSYGGVKVPKWPNVLDLAKLETEMSRECALQAARGLRLDRDYALHKLSEYEQLERASTLAALELRDPTHHCPDWEAVYCALMFYNNVVNTVADGATFSNHSAYRYWVAPQFDAAVVRSWLSAPVEMVDFDEVVVEEYLSAWANWLSQLPHDITRAKLIKTAPTTPAPLVKSTYAFCLEGMSFAHPKHRSFLARVKDEWFRRYFTSREAIDNSLSSNLFKPYHLFVVCQIPLPNNVDIEYNWNLVTSKILRLSKEQTNTPYPNDDDTLDEDENWIEVDGNWVETEWKLGGNSLETGWKLSGNYVETDGNSVETEWKLLETDGNCWKLTVSKMETGWKLAGNSVETGGNLVETGGNYVETGWKLAGNSVETGGNLVETGGNYVETGWKLAGNSVETGGNSVETGGNYVETGGHSVETGWKLVVSKLETGGNCAETVEAEWKLTVSKVETGLEVSFHPVSTSNTRWVLFKSGRGELTLRFVEPPITTSADWVSLAIEHNGFSTGKKAVDWYLSKLSEEHPAKHFKMALQAAAWINRTKEFLAHAERDGRVHSVVSRVARTGRCTSVNPNLQNIDMAHFSGYFIPDSEAFVLIEADYANAENKTGAMVSGDNNFAYSTESGDFHSYQARIYWPDDWRAAEERGDKAKLKEIRRRSKNVTFASAYGAGAAKIAVMIGATKDEAQRILANKDAAYPVLAQRKKDAAAAVESRANSGFHPSFISLWDGARVVIATNNGDWSDYLQRTKRSAYKAWNYLQQGGVAQMVTRAIVEVSKFLSENGFRTRVAINVHDSIVLHAAVDEVDDVLPKLFAIMGDVVPEKLRKLTKPYIHFVSEVGPENALKWGYWHGRPYPLSLEHFWNRWGKHLLPEDQLKLPPEKREAPTWVVNVAAGETLESEMHADRVSDGLELQEVVVERDERWSSLVARIERLEKLSQVVVSNELIDLVTLLRAAYTIRFVDKGVVRVLGPFSLENAMYVVDALVARGYQRSELTDVPDYDVLADRIEQLEQRLREALNQ